MQRVYQQRVFSVTISDASGKVIEEVTCTGEDGARLWAKTYNSLPYRGRSATVAGPPDPQPTSRAMRRANSRSRSA